jgi:hypothetical protein
MPSPTIQGSHFCIFCEFTATITGLSGLFQDSLLGMRANTGVVPRKCAGTSEDWITRLASSAHSIARSRKNRDMWMCVPSMRSA